MKANYVEEEYQENLEIILFSEIIISRSEKYPNSMSNNILFGYFSDIQLAVYSFVYRKQVSVDS